MKKKIKTALLMAVVAAVGFCSYKAYGSYVAGNVSEEELLLAENVEALSAGEGKGKYTGFAKDYTSGQGLYITSVVGNATLGGGLGVGSRISVQVEAQLSGKITASVMNEFKMDCQANMGCYSSCTPLDWRMGDQSTRLDRGC